MTVVQSLNMQADCLKALRWESPSRIPIKVGMLPAAWIKHREALDAVLSRHPLLYAPHRVAERDYDIVTDRRWVAGEHVDEWGCTWSNVKTGMAALVTGFPVPTRDAVQTMEVPESDVGLPHGFMFLRLSYLRGFEELMCDFAEEPPELQMLIDKVLAYNMRQARLRLRAIAAEQPGAAAIVAAGDDLGIQDRLPISPEQWRKYLKPCFARIFRVFRDAGHYVYMHTDGHVLEIIPDLVDCGVNVLNLQVGSNELANLAKVCAGNVCIDLDLDRQMFPYWTPAEIDAHIREAVATLASSEGGLWLSAEIGEDVPLRNVEAILTALEEHSRIC